MSGRSERHAWHSFREVMARRQPEFDGQVPVALLILSACQGCDEHPKATQEDDEVRVHLTDALTVLRPPGMTHEEVADLFARTADDIRAGRTRCV